MVTRECEGTREKLHEQVTCLFEQLCSCVAVPEGPPPVHLRC